MYYLFHNKLLNSSTHPTTYKDVETAIFEGFLL